MSVEASGEGRRQTRRALGRRSARHWQDSFADGLRLTDWGVLTAVFALALQIRFDFQLSATPSLQFRGSTWIIVGFFLALWALALEICRTRDRRILGDGPEEYIRVVQASFLVFGSLSIAAVLTQTLLSRSFVAMVLVGGVVGLLVNRKLARVMLARRRSRGQDLTSTVIVGGTRSAALITQRVASDHLTGLQVVAVWMPDRPAVVGERLTIGDTVVPVYGSNLPLLDVMEETSARAVVVTDTEHYGHDGLKSLTWDLHGQPVDLFLSPNVADVSTARMHLKTVAGMPFLHLDAPRVQAAGSRSKRAFDVVVASAALIVTTPLMMIAALGIRLTSRGPVLYRSERVGAGGRPFSMYKLRTMVSDADVRRAELVEAHLDATPLFKMRADPRVTRIGRVLRRYSIDELPQFFNVLLGDMSIVGPRPPLPAEVDQYEGLIEHRLLVPQGLTGLWQVSGRSDLDWEETVRIDLDYVENWSMGRDLQIVWRTFRAVVKGRGAY